MDHIRSSYITLDYINNVLKSHLSFLLFPSLLYHTVRDELEDYLEGWSSGLVTFLGFCGVQWAFYLGFYVLSLSTASDDGRGPARLRWNYKIGSWLLFICAIEYGLVAVLNLIHGLLGFITDRLVTFCDYMQDPELRPRGRARMKRATDLFGKLAHAKQEITDRSEQNQTLIRHVSDLKAALDRANHARDFIDKDEKECQAKLRDKDEAIADLTSQIQTLKQKENVNVARRTADIHRQMEDLRYTQMMATERLDYILNCVPKQGDRSCDEYDSTLALELSQVKLEKKVSDEKLRDLQAEHQKCLDSTQKLQKDIVTLRQGRTYLETAHFYAENRYKMLQKYNEISRTFNAQSVTEASGQTTDRIKSAVAHDNLLKVKPLVDDVDVIAEQHRSIITAPTTSETKAHGNNDPLPVAPVDDQISKAQSLPGPVADPSHTVEATYAPPRPQSPVAPPALVAAPPPVTAAAPSPPALSGPASVAADPVPFMHRLPDLSAPAEISTNPPSIGHIIPDPLDPSNVLPVPVLPPSGDPRPNMIPASAAASGLNEPLPNAEVYSQTDIHITDQGYVLAILQQSFPDGYQTIRTPSDAFMCGIFALALSCKAQVPGIQSPSIQLLLDLFQNHFPGEQPENMYDHQLARIIFFWGLENNLMLQLGIVGPHNIRPLILRSEHLSDRHYQTLWIENDFKSYFNQTAIGHWQGVVGHENPIPSPVLGLGTAHGQLESTGVGHGGNDQYVRDNTPMNPDAQQSQQVPPTTHSENTTSYIGGTLGIHTTTDGSFLDNTAAPITNMTRDTQAPYSTYDHMAVDLPADTTNDATVENSAQDTPEHEPSMTQASSSVAGGPSIEATTQPEQAANEPSGTLSDQSLGHGGGSRDDQYGNTSQKELNDSTQKMDHTWKVRGNDKENSPISDLGSDELKEPPPDFSSASLAIPDDTQPPGHPPTQPSAQNPSEIPDQTINNQENHISPLGSPLNEMYALTQTTQNLSPTSGTIGQPKDDDRSSGTQQPKNEPMTDAPLQIPSSVQDSGPQQSSSWSHVLSYGPRKEPGTWASRGRQTSPHKSRFLPIQQAAPSQQPLFGQWGLSLQPAVVNTGRFEFGKPIPPPFVSSPTFGSQQTIVPQNPYTKPVVTNPPCLPTASNVFNIPVNAPGRNTSQHAASFPSHILSPTRPTSHPPVRQQQSSVQNESMFSSGSGLKTSSALPRDKEMTNAPPARQNQPLFNSPFSGPSPGNRFSPGDWKTTRPAWLKNNGNAQNNLPSSPQPEESILPRLTGYYPNSTDSTTKFRPKDEFDAPPEAMTGVEEFVGDAEDPASIFNPIYPPCPPPEPAAVRYIPVTSPPYLPSGFSAPSGINSSLSSMGGLIGRTDQQSGRQAQSGSDKQDEDIDSESEDHDEDMDDNNEEKVKGQIIESIKQPEGAEGEENEEDIVGSIEKPDEAGDDENEARNDEEEEGEEEEDQEDADEDHDGKEDRNEDEKLEEDEDLAEPDGGDTNQVSTSKQDADDPTGNNGGEDEQNEDEQDHETGDRDDHMNHYSDRTRAHKRAVS